MAPSSFSLLARDVARRRVDAFVLDGIDLNVGPRTRLGVVGPNGVGKTTLLRLLAGLDRPDRGEVVRTPPDLRVGYLAQERDRPDEPLLAYLGRRTGVAEAEAELEAAGTDLAAGAAGADDRYAGALDAFLALGGADFDSRARQVTADLGLPERLLDASLAGFSGGEAARASLAAILLTRFEVLLLDEPTNDLDFAGLARLEEFLDDLPGGVVVVSHDRAFLERTIRRVLEIDEHSRHGTEYGGGWQGYLDARATARRHAEEGYATYRAERARLEARARTQKDWADQGRRRARRSIGDEPDKNVRRHQVQTSERVAAKARITEKAIERLEAVEKPWESWDLRFRISGAARGGDVVARLRGAVVERGTFRFGPVDLEIGAGERLAIIGPNGSGKTTLLLAILGRLPLAAGERYLGPGVVVGEMGQARSEFDGRTSLLDGFIGGTGMTNTGARSLLAKFGLGAEHLGRSGATLSPGERTRAALARFAAQGVNCLVLDEPTNHLDLPAIEQLERALEEFDGTLVLVTHDRRLLDAVRITRRVDAMGRDSVPAS
jgi:ATPase subunit of ABC transporter with duplicated ATPase domains